MTQGIERRPDGFPLWKNTSGDVVSCTEKVKVLDENYREIRDAVTDALDDAVLMGCSAESIRRILRELVDTAPCPYPDAKP